MRLRIVAIVLAAAVLAGCAPQGDIEPTATPTATVEPTTSATPTPTAEPEPDATDPANWIISFDGVGPLLLGAPVADGLAPAIAAGYAESTVVDGCRVAFLDRAGSPSLAVASWPDDALSQIIVRDLSDGAADYSASTPRTEAGIGIGATREEVLAAHPDASVLGVEYDFFATYQVADGVGRYITFAVTDGIVTAIAPSVRDTFPMELC